MAGYAIVPDIDAPELTGIDIAVWAALCRFADWEMEDGKPVKSKAGTCYPSIQGLIGTTRFGKTAVCASLKKLESLGYIVRTQRQKGKGFATTEYTLVVRQTNSAHSEQFATRTRVVRDTNKGCSPDEQGLFATRTQPYPYTKPNTKPSDHADEGKPAAGGVTLAGVIQLWNDRLAAHLCFPMVQKETPARKKAFQARVNEAKERRSLTWWEAVIGKLAASEFMCASAREKAGWLNFDWLLNENNLVKVLEGRYDGRKTPFPRGQPRGNPSMAEYLAELQKDPFFGGSGEEDMSDGYREQAGNDGVRSLPEGGGRPVRAGSPEQRGSQSLRPAVTGF